MTVRAFDLGVPALSSEVPVLIYTDEVQSRLVRFVINDSPEQVTRQQDRIR